MIAWKERKMPTTYARSSRWEIFQSIRHPGKDAWREIEMDLPGFGPVRVRSAVGQMHALLMEAIQFYAQKVHILPNKVTCVLVDMHDLRMTLAGGGGSRHRYGQRGVKELARELRQVTVSGVETLMVDGILDRLVPTEAMVRHPVTGAPRPLWRAEFTPSWGAWSRADPIPLHYDPRPLAAIRAGLSAAIARRVLTHRDTPSGGWKLDGLIRAVGAQPTRRNRQMVRQDAEPLAACGVIVIGDRVFQEGGVPSLPAGVTSLPAPYLPCPRA
jgi:hypothetical protein